MSFYAALIASGLRPREVVADGRWHRCPTEDKPRKKNGCYLLEPGGARGVWKNYALDADWNKWESNELTTAQRVDADRRARELREREAKRRIAAIQAMRAYFDTLPVLRGGHPYLEAKGLSMLGCGRLRLDGDLLVIPAYRAGWLVSVQTISPEGEKRYRTGCPMRGASYRLERQGALTCLAEGFATGLAIYQSLPIASVIVCFDLGNMVHIARTLNASGMLVVCGDNDWKTAERAKEAGRAPINPGVEQGRQAAEAIGCGFAYPQGIEGSDWADALKEWCEKGPARLRMEILRHARFVEAAATA